MSFNIALSGLSAASSELRVTGNNIANASTVAFKGSRAEFADVYASSLVSSGNNQIGGGVKLARVAQRFEQGTISFTNNSLDLAIDGNGFFVLSDNGAQTFTRAGAFGLDSEGFFTSPNGARVQGFAANSEGALSGILGDLQITATSQTPEQTTGVIAAVNLDARSSVLSEIGSLLNTTGTSIGVAQLGLPNATATALNTSGPPTPFDFSVDIPSSINAGAALVPFDFTGAAGSTFEIEMSGSTTPTENTTVTITLDGNISTLQDIIDDIRDDLGGSGIGVDVREDPNNLGRLQFFAVSSGAASTITIDPSDNAVFGTGVTRADVEGVLGGMALGQGGAGASNTNPDPYGGTATTGSTGNATSATFDVTLTDSSGNNGTATITLNRNVTDASSLLSDIEDDIAASGISVTVQLDPADPTRIQFVSSVPGENSSIAISNLNASNIGVTTTDVTNALNLATGVSIPGVDAASNGYASQRVDVIYPDGTEVSVNIPDSSSAAAIASIFSGSQVPDVSAAASTIATIPQSSFNNVSGTMVLTINGVTVAGTNLTEIAETLDQTVPGLATVSAALDASGDLVVTDQIGNDLVFGITGDPADSMAVQGPQGTPVSVDTSGTQVASVGGTVEISLAEGLRLDNANPAVTNLFGVLDDNAYTDFALNTFDPTDQNTYNGATSLTIYDSLGNPHALELFFVKERFTPGVPGEEANRWTVYTLVDGQDVGDPDLNLPPPQDSEPTRASFNLRFNADGTVNASNSDQIVITNWLPLGEDGQPNGATGPQNVLAGGGLPIPRPPTSSNFSIQLDESTQFGRDFALGSIEQDGFATGRLASLTIDDTGVVEARFTNGQNTILGQVAIADFVNTQGLSAIGDSSWIETNDSGVPVIAAPGSGSLGAITSGALEDSNIELSEQLVALIIAQRNFQANSRTISTSDEITQTIINI